MANTSLAIPASVPMPALFASAGDRAGIQFIEFFASAIRNPHTRRAYARAAGDFFAWCVGAGVMSITAVQPLHVASWIELQTATHAAPTVKQRLATIRHLFDWLVTGQVMPHNPAASVRGPLRYIHKRICMADHGTSPLLDPIRIHRLLGDVND